MVVIRCHIEHDNSTRAMSIDDDAPIKAAALDVSSVTSSAFPHTFGQIAKRVGGVHDFALYVDDAE